MGPTETHEDQNTGSRSRDAFALAALAALGPFPQVHLAPRLAPGALNAALGSYLRLQDDELLLALIDGIGGKLEGRCALTTQRIYWVGGEAVEDAQPPGTPWPPRREKVRALRCFRHALHCAGRVGSGRASARWLVAP